MFVCNAVKNWRGASLCGNESSLLIWIVTIDMEYLEISNKLYKIFVKNLYRRQKEHWCKNIYNEKGINNCVFLEGRRLVIIKLFTFCAAKKYYGNECDYVLNILSYNWNENNPFFSLSVTITLHRSYIYTHFNMGL